MASLLQTALRFLLILALAAGGVMAAHAAVPASPVPAPVMSEDSDSRAHCHEDNVDMAATPAADLAAATTDSSHHSPECCKSGSCACSCAAPATASAAPASTWAPAAATRIVPRAAYQASHLLPLPFRPPIA